MSTVKTAISLDAPLLERIDEAARELELPRSRLLARAAEEFLRRRDNARLLTRLDEAYSGGPTPEEESLGKGRREVHRRLVARER